MKEGVTHKIEQSEIPTARRDKPNSFYIICAIGDTDVHREGFRNLQNKANLNEYLIYDSGKTKRSQNLDAETMKNKIEHSEIPAVRRDKPNFPHYHSENSDA